MVAAAVCSTVFETLGRIQARIHGMPELPLIIIAHPLGGLTADKVALRAGQAGAQLSAVFDQVGANK